jgi:2-iminobutanoate/2-iminopropanoate deaminase
LKATPVNAPDATQPVGGYAQAMLLEGATRLLFISGQIPEAMDKTVPADFRGQADLCWANVDAQLRAVGMTRDNLIKVTIFLSDRKYTADYREARKAYLGERTIGLTAIVTGIFDPVWLLEIEAIAAA